LVSWLNGRTALRSTPWAAPASPVAPRRPRR
jgi:hypothetical protein